MATPHVKLLDLADPKRIKETINVLIDLYDNIDGDVRDVASNAVNIANQALTATRDYTPLQNKPKINGVELEGDQSSADIGIVTLTNKELENLLK